jgi:hypothetical protein
MVPCADDEYGRVMVGSDRTYQELARLDGTYVLPALMLPTTSLLRALRDVRSNIYCSGDFPIAITASVPRHAVGHSISRRH